MSFPQTQTVSTPARPLGPTGLAQPRRRCRNSQTTHLDSEPHVRTHSTTPTASTVLYDPKILTVTPVRSIVNWLRFDVGRIFGRMYGPHELTQRLLRPRQMETIRLRRVPHGLRIPLATRLDRAIVVTRKLVTQREPQQLLDDRKDQDMYSPDTNNSARF